MRWLLQGGPDAIKHKERIHPIVTFFFHYVVVAAGMRIAHDAIVDAVYGNYDTGKCETSSETLGRRRFFVARFLAIYFLAYFCIRLALRWREKPYKFYSEFYGQTFLCSVTIFNSALGFHCNRPIIAQAFCVAVGIDQLLWYFDIAGYLFFGTFPIGVCKYLFKPGSTWLDRITSSHHLWTIPLVLWVCGGVFHWLALPLSFIVVPLNVIISHAMTPIAIRIPGKDDEEDLYLNVNLSHEVWADIKLKILMIGEVPYAVRLICWWYILNTVIFGLLYGFSILVSDRSNQTLC